MLCECIFCGPASLVGLQCRLPVPSDSPPPTYRVARSQSPYLSPAQFAVRNTMKIRTNSLAATGLLPRFLTGANPNAQCSVRRQGPNPRGCF
jgi:hypothetical protein